MRNLYKIVLSNIINHGESDVQWQISRHLSVYSGYFMKRERSFLNENCKSIRHNDAPIIVHIVMSLQTINLYRDQ